MPEHHNHQVANIRKIRKLSPIWIIPLVTLFIGLWLIISYLANQGPVVTLITTNAEGIVGGKTTIKSRSVDIGIVKSVTLSKDLNNVVIKAQLNNKIERLINKDTLFWVVKPQIGREGISGLGTILSGIYIELQPGNNKEEQRTFHLLDSPPLSAPDAKGIRIKLKSNLSNVLSAGDPVLFRGLRVGTIERSHFDTANRSMGYQLFISAPFDKLVTTNVRFWQDSGFTIDLTTQGVKLEMPSIQTLFSGGVSFDVPDGWTVGEPIANGAIYDLYHDKASIQNSLYSRHENFIILFKESIRGLRGGAPVEFKGIRIGTVVESPYYTENMWNNLDKNFSIPVLIRIEPDRFKGYEHISQEQLINDLFRAEKKGLRASLKTSNLITGALYIDFDFYDINTLSQELNNDYPYPVIASMSGNLSQIQQKFVHLLDKLNDLPLLNVTNEIEQTLRTINKLLANKDTQALPADVHIAIMNLDNTLKGMQPGSPAYNQLVNNLQQIDTLVKELQPLARTLNSKSNALVFEANHGSDPEPKGAKK